ncbi:unnamed protein product [Linum trigynum]|uniref:Nucleotide-diphospho-sugar transferase domain-containing protein n=1 Tax=Linum trigynum TaxID=586398 RepID=A0AAV2CQ46_9ROSI
METRTVIITAIDNSTTTPRRPGSPPAVDDFLESLRNGTATKHLVDHLVILTFDPQTFHYCKSIHPHCFKYPNFNSLHDHQPHKLVGLFRNELLRQVLEFGYNFFYTDVILSWERNPLLLFGSEDKISIGCEFFSTVSNTNNAEYFYMKSGPVSIAFFKMWKLINVIYPDTIVHNSLCRLRFNEKFGPVVKSMIKSVDSTK